VKAFAVVGQLVTVLSLATRPLVYGRALKVNPLVAILSVLVGSSWSGSSARCSRCPSPL
jgi:predicted PurR-regulated permease PerM